jgi:hypothetical protein
MRRRLTLIVAVTIGSAFSLPPDARADQAIMLHDGYFEISPGAVVDHSDVLVISRYGIPTVKFDGATGFADSETVVATITLSTQKIEGLGTVELLSSPTLSATTPADWTSGDSAEFQFEPVIELRYTAPSAAALGCAEHPGERFTTHLGVAATLVGSAGTMASFSASDFPSVVMFIVRCPAATPRPVPTATTRPTATPHAARTPSPTPSPTPLPSPTPTPSPSPSPSPTVIGASAVASASSVATASVEPTPARTTAPALDPVADVTQVAIPIVAVLIFILGGMGIWLIWRWRISMR